MPTTEDIQRIAALIAQRFKPSKIILFGSRAYGNPRADSDVDLLVLLPIPGSELAMMSKLILAAYEVAQGTFALDILAKDPEQAAKHYRQGDMLFRDAFDRGVVLYEAAA
jgi:predicted nucleotidyltransferase